MKFEIRIEGREPYIVEVENSAELFTNDLMPEEECTIVPIEE